MRDRTTDTARREKVEVPETEPARRAPSAPATIFDLPGKASNQAITALLAEHQIQPKLQVGAVNDPAEAEADHLADQALRTVATAGPEGEQTDEPARAERVSRRLRRASAPSAPAATAPGHGPAGGPVEDTVARDIDAARSGGAPLAPEVRSKMEQGFGADFRDVRVHTGGKADALSRSLNAKAFTTGRDIFFASGVAADERVLAHELAHTVQQGAAPTNKVERFMAVSQFEELTYESWHSMKSTAQNEIIKMLEAYKGLGKEVKEPDGTKKVILDTDKLDNGIQLVKNMKAASQAYINAKENEKNKKEKRYAGFLAFAGKCDVAIKALEQRKVDSKMTGDKQLPVKVDSSGLVKLQEHYKGTLSSAMEKGALLVSQLAPNNGDSGEAKLDLEIPVSPGVFIGAKFKFEAKKLDPGNPDNTKEGPTEVSAELGFVVGGSVLFAKIQAGLGGYFKAQGKTPESAMKLISYGLYRRCKESSVIPSEISSKLWGGTADDKGKKKAEDWSLEVEKEEFTDDDDSYVETGGFAEVMAKAEGGIGSAELGAKGFAGKRHDKESLENTKGGAGKKNTKGDNWFAQETTGRAIEAIELSAAASLALGFGGDVKLVLNFRSAGGKGSKSKFEGYDIEVRVRGTVPAGGFEAKLIDLLTSFSETIKKVQKEQLTKATTTANVKEGAALSYGIADTTVMGVTGMPVSQALKKTTLDKLLEPDPKGSESGGSSSGGGGQVGLEIAYNLSVSGTDSSAVIDLRHIAQSGAKLPSLLAAELTKRKRIIGGRKVNSGGWGWVY